MTMGPDFSCMEWLMNAGATSILLSDGTVIKSRKEMRLFLKNHGFDVNNLQTVFLFSPRNGKFINLQMAPETKIVKEFYSNVRRESSINSDITHDERWRHVPPVYIKEVISIQLKKNPQLTPVAKSNGSGSWQFQFFEDSTVPFFSGSKILTVL